MEVSQVQSHPHRNWGFSKEAVFALICVAVGAVGLKLVYDPMFWNDTFFRDHPVGSERRIQVGTLEPIRIGIRSRAAGSPVWNDIDSTSHPIFDGQSVFTNDSGRAMIRLNSGLTAEISESSLITIYQEKSVENESSNALPVLQVQQGVASLNSEAHAKPAKLLVDGKVFEVKKQSSGDSFSMKVSRVVDVRNDGSLRLEVTQGQSVQIESKGVTKVLKAGEVASLSLLGGASAVPQLRIQDQQVVKIRDSRPKKFEIKPITLGQNDVSFASVTQPESLEQLWIPVEWPKIEGAEAYRLEITTESGRSIASQSMKENRWIWKLSDFDYRAFQYRVSALFEDGERLTSDWKKLELQPVTPEMTAPIRDARLFLDDPDRSPLVWKKTRLTLGYEIQLSQDIEFRKQAFSQQTSQNFIWLTRLGRGKWYWRVRAMLSQGVSEWSDTSSFTWSDSSPAPSEPSPE